MPCLHYVTAAQQGDRVDQIAALAFPEYSRARLQAWILSADLQVDGVSVKPKARLKAGQCLQLNAQLSAVVEAQAQSIDLSVRFEDEHLLVIDKPVGMVVHPAPGHAQGTLVNALLHYHPSLNHLPRAGIIHRIDKDTSGLLMVAKTLQAHTQLVKQLQLKEVQRVYDAVAVGAIIAGGCVDAPIGRHPTQRIKMAVNAHGKPARTHYRVSERFTQFTRLTVTLETGRTHQIRVHMAHIGYPLVGDATYGRKGWLPKGGDADLLAVLHGLHRQALHATQLSFTHPVSAKWIEVHSPLPDDLQQLLIGLRAYDAVR
jgi:23S rRNA pseudouridine1911/1915/1917 synthase